MNLKRKASLLLLLCIASHLQCTALRAQETLTTETGPATTPTPEPAPELKFQELPPDNDDQKMTTKIEDVNQIEDMPARTVFIELEPVAEAKSSQIQIRPYEQQWAEPYLFNIDHELPSLRVRLTPGRYSIRTRSLDEEKVPGNWGKWMDFWIRFRPPESVYPPADARIEPKTSTSEKITFEWPTIPQAKGYLFLLMDKDGNVIKLSRTKQTWLNVELNTGQKYKWGIVPISSETEYTGKDKAALTQLFTFNDFEILHGPTAGKTVRFEIEKHRKALKYEFEVLKFVTETETGPPSYFESYDPNYKITLSPGVYEMRARMYLDDGTITHWSAPYKVFVQFSQPKPITPLQNAIVDSTDFDESRVSLEWEPQEAATSYWVYVYDEVGNLVLKKEVTEPKAQVELKHDSTYRWQVMAYGPGESYREPPKIQVDSPMFKIDHYIPLLMSTPEEPSHIYSWGRYWLSYINYEGKNYDANSLINQPILGGTGELALGYWHRKSGLGILAHGSLSGFFLENTESVHNWAEGGLHIGKRVIYEGTARLRYWLGITYREFPEFVANGQLTNYGYTRIKTYGPQVQVSYMDQFNDTYGWHTYGVLYYSAQGIGSPNGLDQVPQLSMTLGIFGTYRYSDRMKWMVGYSFKYDSVSYKSSDRSGNDNISTSLGHFLNLSIEYGLTNEKFK